jgi:xylulose-5-phosphate/fructose-6-phosphate phosphoketolase
VADLSPGLTAYEPSKHERPRLQGKENINTPLDLAIQNQIDRFSVAIDLIDRVPKLQRIGGHAKEELRNLQIKCKNYAYEHGIDDPDVEAWKWPY